MKRQFKKSIEQRRKNNLSKRTKYIDENGVVDYHVWLWSRESMR